MEKTSIAQELKKARDAGYALGAFNIFNYVSARAVIVAAQEEKKPVILQTSVGTVRYYGAEKLYSMLDKIVNEAEVPVYLHLDHCTDVEFAKECVDAGWDSIMIDASKYPLDKNISITKEAADYAHQKGVQAEGELGVIEGVEEEVHADEGQLASYEECVRFVRESHVDLFAPALGTAHGVYKGIPKIDFELARQLGETIETPIVCHGGTGLSEETFSKLITEGVTKVNISTALKHAYIDGAKAYIEQKPEEYNPLKMEEEMFQKLKQVAADHIRIFANGK